MRPKDSYPVMSGYDRESSIIYIVRETDPKTKEKELNSRLLLHAVYTAADMNEFYSNLLMCDDYIQLALKIKDKKLK